jgi:hypothetical protein
LNEGAAIVTADRKPERTAEESEEKEGESEMGIAGFGASASKVEMDRLALADILAEEGQFVVIRASIPAEAEDIDAVCIVGRHCDGRAVSASFAIISTDGLILGRAVMQSRAPAREVKRVLVVGGLAHHLVDRDEGEAHETRRPVLVRGSLMIVPMPRKELGLPAGPGCRGVLRVDARRRAVRVHRGTRAGTVALLPVSDAAHQFPRRCGVCEVRVSARGGEEGSAREDDGQGAGGLGRRRHGGRCGELLVAMKQDGTFWFRSWMR